MSGARVASGTAFFLCDIQERFRSIIYRFPAVVHTGRTLVRASHALGCPLIVTQQYPKAFKPIVPELAELLNPAGAPAHQHTPVFDKLMFSMMTPEVRAHIASKEGAKGGPFAFETAVLFGIEAHVCVQQTALDLLADGKRVLVVTDGVSSQRTGDRTIALQQMSAAGARLTTTESALYTLLGGADHPSFKEISKILVDHHKLGRDVAQLDQLH